MTNCLFFGDSITYGEYDGILGGWVDDLKRFLHGRYYNENAQEVNAFNLGIGGETTEGLLLRMENEIKPRISPDENLIFLFYGANDLAIRNNQEVIPLQNFETNIFNAIEIAKKYTTEVFLISILPISEKIDGVTVSSGKMRTNKRIIEYNQILKQIADSQNIEFLDLHSLFTQSVEEFISKDGVHPNEKGYKIISEKVKPILEKYL